MRIKIKFKFALRAAFGRLILNRTPLEIPGCGYKKTAPKYFFETGAFSHSRYHSNCGKTRRSWNPTIPMRSRGSHGTPYLRKVVLSGIRLGSEGRGACFCRLTPTAGSLYTALLLPSSSSPLNYSESIIIYGGRFVNRLFGQYFLGRWRGIWAKWRGHRPWVRGPLPRYGGGGGSSPRLAEGARGWGI